MELKIIHLYPDLMNLYGSYANVLALGRYWEALGHTVTVETVAPGASFAPETADVLFMGAGTERSQQAALAALAPVGDAIKAAAERGTAMLFAGTAMELLGASITTREGREYKGIGLADFTTLQGERRLVGDVYGFTTLFGEPVVGFMNKASRISGVETPLLTRCALGFGNETEGGPEGFHWKNVFASHLTGPILVKNPRLLEAVATTALARRGSR